MIDHEETMQADCNRGVARDDDSRTLSSTDALRPNVETATANCRNPQQIYNQADRWQAVHNNREIKEK